MKAFLSALAGLLTALPRILDLIDALVGSARKRQERRASVSLEKRQEAKRDAAQELKEAKDEKSKRRALRKLKRLGE